MSMAEKDALLQFMGQIYGEAKRHDQMLVGPSVNLKPKSDEIKNIFEQTLRSPVQANTQPTQPAPSTPSEPALAEQSLQSLPAPQIIVHEPDTPHPVMESASSTPTQLEFDLSEPSKIDRLIELMERQNKLIANIDKNIQQLCKQPDLILEQNKLSSKRNGKSTTSKG